MDDYREVQANPPWWATVIVIFAAVSIWATLVGILTGRQEGPLWLLLPIWLLVGVGLPLFFRFARLIYTVGESDIRVQYTPFVDRRIPFSEIIEVTPRTYKPIREFGGWGIRYGAGGKRAYSMRGYQGVELTLTDGKTIMLGSDMPDALADALRGRVK